MHFPNSTLRAALALPFFGLACTSEILDLFPPVHGTDGGDAVAQVPNGAAPDAGVSTGQGGSAPSEAGISLADATIATGSGGATMGTPEAAPQTSPGGGDVDAAEASVVAPPTCKPSDCAANAHCRDDAPTCACNAGYLGDGVTCHSVADPLNGQRIELPCLEPANRDELCRTVHDDPVATRAIDGDQGTTYQVMLHIRGVVELKSYFGGSSDGAFRMGADPRNDAWNIYRLEVSDPPATYYLNSGPENMYTTALDETHAITVRGGATVRLVCNAEDHTNGAGVLIRNQDENGTPLASPAGVEPADHPFDGQFLQIDVVSSMVKP